MEKFLTASPPNKSNEMITSNVVNDVTRVLDKV